jgi:hypothetical protein
MKVVFGKSFAEKKKLLKSYGESLRKEDNLNRSMASRGVLLACALQQSRRSEQFVTYLRDAKERWTLQPIALLKNRS